MLEFLVKMKPKKSKNLPLSRKELRKQQRIEKKQRRNQYYNKSNKLEPVNDEEKSKPTPIKKGKAQKKTTEKPHTIQSLSVEESRKQEKKQQNKLQKQMQKQRIGQLRYANEEEDKTIRKLEKQLKLHKRKSKSIPKSFTVDGLDYLLEVCDNETMESAALAEQQLEDANGEFEEDLALITGQTSANKATKGKADDDNQSDSDDDDDDDDDIDDEDEVSDFDENASESDEAEEIGQKRQKPDSRPVQKSKKVKFDEDSGDSEIDEQKKDVEDGLQEEMEDKGDENTEDKEIWEDIYGRLRTKDGSVIEQKEKYIPPAIRAKLEAESIGDSNNKDRLEKLNRLRRQLKGLLNRLAESNMYTISNQIENLYMNNSRNDMNNTITNLILESIITNVITPERLLIEHVVLITVLHANVGTEVGAHFLQTVVKKFDECYNDNTIHNTIENKTLDNTINTISQLYNFKLFDSRLIYDILKKLTENFDEKDVECILHILKSVGFNLRKDDPVALKNLILYLQKRAASTTSETIKDNPRIKFMLEILLAIKNNNVSKIPNYDNSYPEHLKKIMKTFIRKGNYVTQLNISLEDLLKVEERGRWWVVGSAWKGNLEQQSHSANAEIKGTFSQKLLDLAKKQRMNTDTRRNIFCVIMSAEDYMDAFEKLLRLGLKNQQERDIIHVILHCCLQEKQYNPYYGFLSQKFCEYDRKYQLTIKYSIWDKLKTLKDCSSVQISNLAKLLVHLFLEKSLSISILKIIQFGELDKVNLRFIRQILLGILLYNDFETCQGVFENIIKSDKLKMFRESLRLFIHHFLLRNLKTNTLPEEQRQLLEDRGRIIDKILSKKI